MSVISEVGAFAGVAAVLTVTPGLDTTLVLRAAADQGPRYAYATVFGISAGVMCWGTAAAVGASAVLAASPTAYTALSTAGAVYLSWLGVGMLRRARLRGRQGSGASQHDTMEAKEDTPRRSWSRGFASNLLNPRFGLFYMAMLPQFIPDGASHLLMGLLLAFVHNIEDLLWFSLLILGVRLLGGWLARPAVQRGLDVVAGVVVIGFGVRLVVHALLTHGAA